MNKTYEVTIIARATIHDIDPKTLSTTIFKWVWLKKNVEAPNKNDAIMKACEWWAKRTDLVAQELDVEYDDLMAYKFISIESVNKIDL